MCVQWQKVLYRIGSLENATTHTHPRHNVLYRIGSLEKLPNNTHGGILVLYRIGSLEISKFMF